MAFRYSDTHREEYLADGLTVLRGLIPASLLGDLRRQADAARGIARAHAGPQVQRLQPVYAYPELDHGPFRDFLALDGMREVVTRILGPDHAPSDIMGILFEPAESAWCTHWHRDWGYNVPGIDLDSFFAAARDPAMFNQLNGALYDDHSLWVVPGSHGRRDSEAERAAFPAVPPAAPALDEGMGAAERELACSAYARHMPGARPVALLAGDVAFYRSCAWHLGVYVPYARRATLHDGYYGPEDRAWQAEARRMSAEALAARGRPA